MKPSHSRAPRLCRFCCQEIPPVASVCHHCNRVQNLRNVLHIELGFLISLVISMALVLLAGVQLVVATTDRARAGAALEEAKQIRNTAEELRREQDRLAESIAHVQRESFSNLCVATGGTFDPGSLVCHLATGKDLAFSPGP